MTHPFEIQAHPPGEAPQKLVVMASNRAHALLSVRELFPGWQVLAVRRKGEW